jgi:coenzyme F420-0:L-glutamate ligase/coenzyme F420-1:gamma-L-glutamate ligase
MSGELRVIPVRGIGEVVPGDDLSAKILDALAQQQIDLLDGDVVVVTQKVVSKAEGQIIDPTTVEPSDFAHKLAANGPKDAQHYEIVLRESRRIVRMTRGVLITESNHGWICANSGVDESNVDGQGRLTLLPKDSDASAAGIRKAIAERKGVDVAVIISDTFGRPWREGQVNVAIGVAGISPLNNFAGQPDTYGYTMNVTSIAVADELAGTAELVMGKVDAVPVAIIRGYEYIRSESATAQELIRAAEKDLFR